MIEQARIAYDTLRSAKWFAAQDLRSFAHRSRLKQMGFTGEDHTGKPVVAIINTWSELNSCHYHLRDRAAEVKRGVWQAGGFPVELPVMSLGEPFMKPTTMLYRNLLSMETEELLRANPIDGVVLLGGCDKTTPALLMGAASMNLPTIFVPAGPMLTGNWRGQKLGSGTDVLKYWDELRAGTITQDDWKDLENGTSRSVGTCMTMGTAVTMMSAVEAMGLSLSGASAIPAVDSAHPRMASLSGRRIVDMVWQDQTIARFLTPEAFDNAITTLIALAGSTNGVIHLTALAGRVGIKLDLERFDAISRRTPIIVDIRPSGSFLMEDFFYAGGLPAMLARIPDLLNLDCPTVNGVTLGEAIENAACYNDAVIRPRDKVLSQEGGLAVLRGNLAPDGALIKHSAMSARFARHQGPAVVFRDHADMTARIDDPDLDITEGSVIVLKNAGPQGAPGMPEWGQLPIPRKLLKAGVRDMIRISDARMSGTSYGACILHVSPESYVGGTLALVQDGDIIALDVEARSLSLLVDEDELEMRRSAWRAPPPRFDRGYGVMFARHVGQADKGCDFDFLVGSQSTAEPEIH